MSKYKVGKEFNTEEPLPKGLLILIAFVLVFPLTIVWLTGAAQ